MKKRNIENIKTGIIVGMVAFSTLAIGELYREANRRGGLSKNQEMTLISKQRYGKNFNHIYHFDTDGNTNTAEAVAQPISDYQKYYGLTRAFKIGEKKSWKSWDDEMDNHYTWQRQLSR